jgi:hypothetical protein
MDSWDLRVDYKGFRYGTVENHFQDRYTGSSDLLRQQAACLQAFAVAF